jgi:paraquat-inducible protein B
MNELPQTGRHRTVLPGLVWAVPLAALLVVAYLGINAWAHRGEVITVTFNRAADARPGDTKVLYQGVEAGHLLKIVPNKDGRRLDFVIRLRPEAAAGLNTNARFWLIGASPNLSDLSSLRAVVSGVAIGYAPGTGGTPTTTFEGLDKAPTVLPGDRGTRYLLDAHTLGSIREGSVLLFHGQSIGKVTDVQFKGPPGFKVEVFVFQPYDSLVKAGSKFWKISPLRLSLAGGGVSANLAPVSTLLAGGIEVEGPEDPHAVQAPAEAEFTLYSSHAAARQGLSGPTVRYDFAFRGTGGDLDEESGVTLLGFQVGEVEAAHLAYDATGEPYTAVTALLYPQELGVSDPDAKSDADWRSATDAKIRKLLKFGYRARRQQMPALLGNLSIALVESGKAAPGDLIEDGPNPRIPSAPGSADVADIASQADQILSKINQIPIAAIGNDLQHVTEQLNKLVSSPQTAESLQHVNSTLAEVDRLLAQVQPQIGPLIAKLNQAAGQISDTALAAHQLLGSDGSGTDNLPDTIKQLDEAARSIRTLTDYLSRHPEALIRGKRPEK